MSIVIFMPVLVFLILFIILILLKKIKGVKCIFFFKNELENIISKKEDW